MYTKIVSLIVLVLIGASFAIAEEAKVQKESGLSAWLRDMQKKIEQIVPKKQLQVTTGVAGIRGSKEAAQAKLYWKGKQGDEVVTEDELGKFKKGVDLALEGDKASAQRELEEFMKLYPDSALIPDAAKTLAMVKTEEKK